MLMLPLTNIKWKLLAPKQMLSFSMEAVKVSMQPTTASSETQPSFEGKSIISFDSVTFLRPKESAKSQQKMQQNTGLVEAIILEVKDRERIGGASLKADAICCNKQLADQGSCKLGEVIIQNNPEQLRVA